MIAPHNKHATERSAVRVFSLLVGISVGRSTTDGLFSAGLRGFGETGRTGLKVDSSVEICTRARTHREETVRNGNQHSTPTFYAALFLPPQNSLDKWIHFFRTMTRRHQSQREKTKQNAGKRKRKQPKQKAFECVPICAWKQKICLQ